MIEQLGYDVLSMHIDYVLSAHLFLNSLLVFFLVHWLLPTFMALSFYFEATIRHFAVFGLTSKMLVNKHSDYLALGFFNCVDFIGSLGLLSETPYVFDTISASRISLRFY